MVTDIVGIFSRFKDRLHVAHTLNNVTKNSVNNLISVSYCFLSTGFRSNLNRSLLHTSQAFPKLFSFNVFLRYLSASSQHFFRLLATQRKIFEFLFTLISLLITQSFCDLICYVHPPPLNLVASQHPILLTLLFCSWHSCVFRSKPVVLFVFSFGRYDHV